MTENPRETRFSVYPKMRPKSVHTPAGSTPLAHIMPPPRKAPGGCQKHSHSRREYAARSYYAAPKESPFGAAFTIAPSGGMLWLCF
jgi:hypothetical protein